MTDDKKKNKFRDGLFGACLGGGTAFMAMNYSGKVYWPIVIFITVFSFIAAYRAGNDVIVWISKLDDYFW